MPANRSRTTRWRDCLQQLRQRGGGLEISVARGDGNDEPEGADLLWRVRILDLNEQRITLERPTIAGGVVKLRPGTPLVVVMSIGQNRWMFRSRVLETEGGPNGQLPIEMPTDVERCARRSFLRVTTAQLQLPEVECWPLLDPTTVIAAERANLIQVQSGEASDGEPMILPEVGPKFVARLMNVSGGGVGLLVDPEEASGLDKARMLWMRVALRPVIAEPLGLTARVVHTHMDSSQNRYAGCAFEFAFHPEHRDFIVEQIASYITKVSTGATGEDELRPTG